MAEDRSFRRQLLVPVLFAVVTTVQGGAAPSAFVLATGMQMISSAPEFSPEYREFRPELPPGVERIPLTLGQAIEGALANNPDLMVERLEPQLRQGQVVQAEGDFDPSLEASFKASHDEDAQNSLDFVSTGGTEVILNQNNRQPRIFSSNSIVADVKFSGKTHSGLRYEIGITEEKTSNDVSRTSAVSLFDPEYTTTIGFKLTQPILKGYGERVQLAKIRIRQASREISELNLQQKVIDTLVATISDYYDLLLAFQDFKVRQQKVKMVMLAALDKREQLERGLVVDRDLRQAEVELAKSYEQFLLGRETLLTKSMELARRSGLMLEPGKQRVFLPKGGIAYTPPELQPEELLDSVLHQSPKYRAAMAKVENLQRELAYQRNQLKPELNLEFQGGVNAIAGTVGRSFQGAASGDAKSVSIGLVFSMPMGNRAASGRFQELQVRRNQARYELEKVRREILVEVEKRSLAVQTQQARIRAVRRSVAMASEALEHERDRLEKGQGNELAVQLQQQKLQEAQLREMAALADLQKGLVSLWALEGSLLERYDIDMQHQLELAGEAVVTK